LPPSFPSFNRDRKQKMSTNRPAADQLAALQQRMARREAQRGEKREARMVRLRRRRERRDGRGGRERTDARVAFGVLFLSRSPPVPSLSTTLPYGILYTLSQQSSRSNDPYSARPGGAKRSDDADPSSPSNHSLARGPAAAAAAAIASAAAIAAPEAAYCELCDVSGNSFFTQGRGRSERERE